MTSRDLNRHRAQHWHDAYALKQNYERCNAVEKLRRLPHQTIFKLAEEDGRQFVSLSRRIPKRLDMGWYFFARSVRKGVFKDVVQVQVERGRNRLRVERIVLCTEMRVARTPSSYWIRQLIHAQAGYSPAIHVDEFLANWDVPLFSDEIEGSLPRSNGYKYRGLWVPCAWSEREYDLNGWKKRLSTGSARQLISNVTRFLDQYHHVNISDALDRTIRETLTPLLVKCLRIPNPELGTLALRTLDRFDPRHPERNSRYLLPLSLDPDPKMRLHVIAIQGGLIAEDRDRPGWRIIENLLQDESAQVRQRAIEALHLQHGVLMQARTHDALRMIEDMAKRDPDRLVAAAAVEKLASYRGER
jgi:hypothetical protein